VVKYWLTVQLRVPALSSNNYLIWSLVDSWDLGTISENFPWQTNTKHITQQSKLGWVVGVQFRVQSSFFNDFCFLAKSSKSKTKVQTKMRYGRRGGEGKRESRYLLLTNKLQINFLQINLEINFVIFQWTLWGPL